MNKKGEEIWYDLSAFGFMLPKGTVHDIYTEFQVL